MGEIFCLHLFRYSEVLNVTTKQVSKLINSLKDKGLIDIKIIYKKDSKQIEKRELIPIMNNTNTYPTKVPYSSPAKVLYPMEQKVKDNKYNINNYKNNNKRNGKFETELGFKRAGKNCKSFSWLFLP